jgi:YD repeat-containing protein
LARNSHVSSTFDFDRANRLEVRTDRVGGYAFITRFWYDDNDHLTGIDYSSGRQVRYELDSAGRIAAVRQDGAPLADQFAYHPSGALASYHAANGGTHSLSYDLLNRVSRVKPLVSTTSLLATIVSETSFLSTTRRIRITTKS